MEPVMEAIKATQNKNIDKRYAQCYVALRRGTIALATTMRDNCVALGIEEPKRIRLMESIMQPALAEMEGAEPIAMALVGDPSAGAGTEARRGRPDIISRLTGIPATMLVNSRGETNRWAMPCLSELRNSVNRAYQSTLFSLMSMAQEAENYPANPHMRIIGAFKEIRPWM